MTRFSLKIIWPSNAYQVTLSVSVRYKRLQLVYQVAGGECPVNSAAKVEREEPGRANPIGNFIR